MYAERTIAVIVPCFNEERLVGRVLETMPAFVDRVLVVDDASSDRTSEVVRRRREADPRVLLIRRERNGGVGAAIRTGYRWCREERIDVAVVMAGDGQMDPADLPALLDPVVAGRTDYAKGDRLARPESRQSIPWVRYAGIRGLSLLTRLASGHHSLRDSQSGYTALGREALARLPLSRIWPGYGVPNNILCLLKEQGCRIEEVPVRAVYGRGERSDMPVLRVALSLPWLLCWWGGRRMARKAGRKISRPVGTMPGGRLEAE